MWLRDACRLFELLCFNLLYVYNSSLHQSALDAISNADASHESNKEQTQTFPRSKTSENEEKPWTVPALSVPVISLKRYWANFSISLLHLFLRLLMLRSLSLSLSCLLFNPQRVWWQRKTSSPRPRSPTRTCSARVPVRVGSYGAARGGSPTHKYFLWSARVSQSAPFWAVFTLFE